MVFYFKAWEKIIGLKYTQIEDANELKAIKFINVDSLIKKLYMAQS